MEPWNLFHGFVLSHGSAARKFPGGNGIHSISSGKLDEHPHLLTSLLLGNGGKGRNPVERTPGGLSATFSQIFAAAELQL